MWADEDPKQEFWKEEARAEAVREEQYQEWHRTQRIADWKAEQAAGRERTGSYQPAPRSRSGRPWRIQAFVAFFVVWVLLGPMLGRWSIAPAFVAAVLLNHWPEIKTRREIKRLDREFRDEQRGRHR